MFYLTFCESGGLEDKKSFASTLRYGLYKRKKTNNKRIYSGCLVISHQTSLHLSAKDRGKDHGQDLLTTEIADSVQVRALYLARARNPDTYIFFSKKSANKRV